MKKIILILTLILVTFNVTAEDQYWKDSITMINGESKRCTSGVFNSDSSFFTFNVEKSFSGEKIKTEVLFEFRSTVDISNNGEIIADIDFYNSYKSKREDIRIRLKPYSSTNKKLFILDNSINTVYAIERMLDLMEKYRYFYIKVFDKQWVEYPFKFSLVGSSKQIKNIKKECDLTFPY